MLPISSTYKHSLWIPIKSIVKSYMYTILINIRTSSVHSRGSRGIIVGTSWIPRGIIV